MSEIILLDLNEPEYNDSFKVSEDGAPSELWQIAAKNRLVALLVDNCLQAAEYRKKRADKKRADNSDYFSAAHNAICISGGRGAGKTAFMRNAENMWLGCREQPNHQLCFAELVDPTLLSGHDRFSNVIVAMLYNQVAAQLSSSSIDRQKKQQINQTLTELGQALEKSSEFEDHTGIDRILKYRSGVQLERHFHQFVEQCVDLLNCQAIVLPIDDVDMALDKAFEVLDDVRRLLSCPYIIPLVSGDHLLYDQVTTVHFEQQASNKNTSDEMRLKGNEIAKSLADAYLTKIFPYHLRLPLKPIDDLLPDLQIKWASESLSFDKYRDEMNHYFNFLFSRFDGINQIPLPSNAREACQLIRMITPASIETIGTQLEVWQNYKVWAQLKRSGIGFVHAMSVETWLTGRIDKNWNISQLLAFNPMAQSRLRLNFAEYPFAEKQQRALAQFDKKRTKGNADVELQKDMLDEVFPPEMKTLAPLPPLEFYNPNLRLSKNRLDSMLKGDQLPEKDIALVLLYTETHHYGMQSHQGSLIYFSRAFEVLVFSILMLTKQNDDKLSDSGHFQKLFKRSPFYSVHAMEPLLFEDVEQADEDGESVDQKAQSRDTHGQAQAQAIQALFEAIKQWLAKHRCKYSELGKKGSVLPLLNAVFNKVFEQLHQFRLVFVPGKYVGEDLRTLARRFEYMVINAFACFMQQDEVVQGRLATGVNVSQLLDHSQFLQSDRTLLRNLKGILKSKEATLSEDEGSDSNPSCVLLQAIWDHPIFTFNHSKSSLQLNKDNRLPMATDGTKNTPNDKAKADANTENNKTEQQEVDALMTKDEWHLGQYLKRKMGITGRFYIGSTRRFGRDNPEKAREYLALLERWCDKRNKPKDYFSSYSKQTNFGKFYHGLTKGLADATS